MVPAAGGLPLVAMLSWVIRVAVGGCLRPVKVLPHGTPSIQTRGTLGGS